MKAPAEKKHYCRNHPEREGCSEIERQDGTIVYLCNECTEKSILLHGMSNEALGAALDGKGILDVSVEALKAADKKYPHATARRILTKGE